MSLDHIAEGLRPLARPLEELAHDPRNARIHDERNLTAIRAALETFGQQKNIVARKGPAPPFVVVAGNGTLACARALGWTHLAVSVTEMTDEKALAYAVADNRTAELAGWDAEVLDGILRDLEAAAPDLRAALEFSQADIDALLADAADPPAGGSPAPWAPPGTANGSLSNEFLVPPFTVLDARAGYWQERKGRWNALGLRSQEGRGENLLRMGPGMIRESIGGTIGGTSVFDPVLCELLLRWFSPPGAHVLDPFAGGSVRGIVSAVLGRRYVGIDLAPAQVEANGRQWIDMDARRTPGAKGVMAPSWINGDSQALDTLLPADQTFDFVLSCPPYFDLERYSNTPGDLSAMTWEAFSAAYRAIIRKAVERLRPDRFAAFVVGEVRNPANGAYRGFVPLTIEAFEAAGARFYNEAVLVTSCGTLPMRVRQFFPGARKLGKTHQNVLIFVKGDPKRATEACGVVDVALPEPEGEEPEAEEAPACVDDPVLDPHAITPVHEVALEGGPAWLKRDDLFQVNGATGSKARACLTFMRGAKGVVTAGARLSPMVSRVARVAQHLGIPCRVHTAGSKALAPEEEDAVAHGAELVKVARTNYLSAVLARAKADAEAHAAAGWIYVPFGLECDAYFDATRSQVVATPFPDGVRRLVVAVGSGMALAAILRGLDDSGRGALPVLGVQVGQDPGERLDRWYPGWRARSGLVLVPHGTPYDKPARVETRWGVRLDPFYEAKAAERLEPGDLLWLVAVRATPGGA